MAPTLRSHQLVAGRSISGVRFAVKEVSKGDFDSSKQEGAEGGIGALVVLAPIGALIWAGIFFAILS